ncbi:hypothetical protein [Sphingomonas alba]|uniref:Uncharacterized protein n=1 Tax=Sphingomonas alba TaxID=2908208 RepID=A0ABT0RNH6_9SPHN|nr:hypothetical protein [Sphingomonas alba]MCL6684118.1 hypothetical protein [Sphingomonas alba]
MASNGRNLIGGRFIQFQRSFLHSAQVSALSLPSRWLLVELQGMFNGTNNGTLFLSVRDAAARLSLVDLKAARKAFDELIQLGLISEAIGASFSVKADEVSRARAWQLNWLEKGGLENLRPVDCARLSKKQNVRLLRRSSVLKRYVKNYVQGDFAVTNSNTLEARMAHSDQCRVENSSTPPNENGGFSPIPREAKSTPHIVP